MKGQIWGANGYIGSHLAAYLSRIGWDIKCFDIHEKLLSGLELAYQKIDVTDDQQFENVSVECDVLFYFIGLTGTIDSVEKYRSFIEVNEIGLLNLLNHLNGMSQKPRIIFPSTRLVYKGVPGVPLTENAEKEFKTVYAMSKYAGEQYLNIFSALYGIHYSVVRIGVPYGNFLSTEYSYGTIGFFLNRARNNQDISLYGDGSLKRSFTHVEDVCRQFQGIALSEAAVDQCFNIDGETFSLREIAHLIAARYGVKVNYTEWPEASLKVESGDTIFAADKMKTILNTPLSIDFKHWIAKQ